MFILSQSKLSIKSKKFFDKCFKAHQPKGGYGRKSQKDNNIRIEEEYTPRIVQSEGSATPKRLREEDNFSFLSGEIKRKFQRKQKMSFSENQNFLDCRWGETATNSSNKKKIYIYTTMNLTEKPEQDLD